MSFENEDWFNLKEINDGIWAISDKTGANCYLVEGKTKSLLIDTGWGLGNLAELVQSLSYYQLMLFSPTDILIM